MRGAFAAVVALLAAGCSRAPERQATQPRPGEAATGSAGAALSDASREWLPEPCRGEGEPAKAADALEARVLDHGGGVAVVDWDGGGGPDLVTTAPGFGAPCVLQAGPDGGFVLARVSPTTAVPLKTLGVTEVGGRAPGLLLFGLGRPAHWTPGPQGRWAGRSVPTPIKEGTPWTTGSLDLGAVGVNGAVIALAGVLPEDRSGLGLRVAGGPLDPEWLLGEGALHHTVPRSDERSARPLARPGSPMALLVSAFAFGGTPAVFVTNATGYDLVFRFDAEGEGREEAWRFGVAAGYDRLIQKSRGADLGDVNGDGRPDLVVATEREGVRLHVADSEGFFEDRAIWAGLFSLTAGRPWFGVLLEDLDLDGDLDLVATGDAEGDGGGLLVLSNEAGRFSRLATPGLKLPSARGAAVLDVEGDGDPDLAVALRGGGVRVVRNDAPPPAWLRVLRPHQRGDGGRPAEYTRLTVRWPDGTVQVRESRRGRGYVSSSDPAVRFARRQPLPVGEPTLHVRAPGGEETEVAWPDADPRGAVVLVPPGTP